MQGERRLCLFTRDPLSGVTAHRPKMNFALFQRVDSFLLLQKNKIKCARLDIGADRLPNGSRHGAVGGFGTRRSLIKDGLITTAS